MSESIQARRSRHDRHNIRAYEWPMTTSGALADAINVDNNNAPDEINQPIHKLILARKAIGDAKLALHAARLLHKDNGDVTERLTELMGGLDEATRRFPLTIIGKQPQGRWRVSVHDPAPVEEVSQVLTPDIQALATPVSA